MSGPSRRRRVLLPLTDPLTPLMAGPTIRAWHLAHALATEHEVLLATTGPCTLEGSTFRTCSVDAGELQRLEQWCEVMVVRGFVMQRHPVLARSNKVIVVDVYDPIHLEQLEQGRDDGERQHLASVRAAAAVLNEQLLRGDYFVCASPKQRDFWLGHLAALGRVNPFTYGEDPTLRSLIDVVPFGLPDTPPTEGGPVLRGVVPGIGVHDKVLLWGGGIYNWLDPLTLLEAVDRLRHRLPEVRLYFLGLAHPSPDVPPMAMASRAVELAERLGLTGTHVFFNERWVDYEDRQDYLLEADVGVSTHLEHIETAFSFRTRLLDCLWARLPMVVTRGDGFAELIDRRGLGSTVPPGDPQALERALFDLLDDGGCRARCRVAIAEVAPAYTWTSATQPLLEFCRTPRRAPDLVHPLSPSPAAVPSTSELGQAGVRGDARRLLHHLRRGDLALVADRALARLRRLRRLPP
jgi:glycosyltransferase involved in cell wall biosynthesis